MINHKISSVFGVAQLGVYVIFFFGSCVCFVQSIFMTCAGVRRPGAGASS